MRKDLDKLDKADFVGNVICDAGRILCKGNESDEFGDSSHAGEA